MGIRFTRIAQIERGKQGEALDFAGKISEYWEEKFGTPVTWGLQVGGELGTVHWHSDYENMAHVEQALGFSMTDDGYRKLVNDANDLFAGPPHDTLIYTM